jgi:hypothetical protein
MTVDEFTWTSLVELEPRLQTLCDEALAAEPQTNVGPDHLWFRPEGIRARLERLVGPLAPAEIHPFLRTMEAYRVAHRKLLRAYIEAPPKM